MQGKISMDLMFCNSEGKNAIVRNRVLVDIFAP